jgi:signal transduction histidine kinase
VFLGVIVSSGEPPRRRRVAQERKPARAGDPFAVREEEQRWLARELHDGPAQSLAAALFGVDLAISAVQRRPDSAVDELQAARELVRDALDDVRALMVGFRPFLLEERGLLVALHALSSNLHLWGPELTLSVHGIAEGERLPAEIELALFRIAQEALSNARRHASATRVAITLVVDGGVATLVVADDGSGFAVDRPERITRGEGLASMHERARRLGGDCAVASKPGQGTRVAVTVPLPLEGEGAGLGEGKL